MFQDPFTVPFLPEMRRAACVNEFPECFFVYSYIFQEFLEIFLRKLLIVPADERDRFFSNDLPVPNLLGRIVACLSHAELDKRRIEMEAVYLVVNAKILRIGSFRALRVCLK